MQVLKIKKSASQKKGQTLLEFVLVSALIGVVSFWALYNLNPAFFKSFFKGSISSDSGIDNNGQMTVKPMGD